MLKLSSNKNSTFKRQYFRQKRQKKTERGTERARERQKEREREKGENVVMARKLRRFQYISQLEKPL